MSRISIPTVMVELVAVFTSCPRIMQHDSSTITKPRPSLAFPCRKSFSIMFLLLELVCVYALAGRPGSIEESSLAAFCEATFLFHFECEVLELSAALDLQHHGVARLDLGDCCFQLIDGFNGRAIH